MQRDGVELDSIGPRGDFVALVTFDPAVAERYGMVEESEFWADDLADGKGSANWRPPQNSAISAGN